MVWLFTREQPPKQTTLSRPKLPIRVQGRCLRIQQRSEVVPCVILEKLKAHVHVRAETRFIFIKLLRHVHIVVTHSREHKNDCWFVYLTNVPEHVWSIASYNLFICILATSTNARPAILASLWPWMQCVGNTGEVRLRFSCEITYKTVRDRAESRRCLRRKSQQLP